MTELETKVYDRFTQANSRGLTLTELAEHLGVARFEAQKALKSLATEGEIEFRSSTDRWYLKDEEGVKVPGAKPQRPAKAPEEDGGTRTTVGLRDMLFDEIELIRSGQGDLKRGLVIAKLADGILKSAELELKFHGQAGKTGTLPQIGRLLLGTEGKK